MAWTKAEVGQGSIWVQKLRKNESSQNGLAYSGKWVDAGWLKVRGSMYLVLLPRTGTWYQVLKCSVRGATYLVLGNRYIVLGTEY